MICCFKFSSIPILFILVTAVSFASPDHLPGREYKTRFEDSINFLKSYSPSGLSKTMIDEIPLTLVIEKEQVPFKFISPGLLEGKTKNISAQLLFKYSKEYNSLCYQVVLTNHSEDTIKDISVSPFKVRMAIDHEKKKPVTRYMTGGYHYDGLYPSRAYQLKEHIFMTNDHAKPVTISNEGLAANSQAYIPMLQFAVSEKKWLSGFTVGFEWSGSWSFNAQWEKTTYTNPEPSNFMIDGNMEFGEFSLLGGQIISFPKVHVIFFEGNSWELLDNAQKKYIAEKVGYKIRSKPNIPKVTYDHWFGIHGNYDINEMMRQAAKAADLGVEFFCLDAGWYGKGHFGSSNKGKWDEPDPDKFPAGIADIKKLSNYCKSRKIGFGMWHDIDSRNGGGDPIDYANPNDRREVLTVFRKWITQWDITWMRWEMTAGHKIRGLEYWLGYYEVMDSLLKEFPELNIECCYGGSTRFDLAMASRTVSTWLNDHTVNADINRYMQTGALRFWPAYFLNMAVRVHRNTGDKEAFPYNVISRMPGTLSFNGDIAQWSDSATRMVKQLVAKFKAVRKLQLAESFYPFSQPQSSRDWDGVCFGDGKKAAQLLYIFRMDGKEEAYIELPGQNTAWKLIMSTDSKASIQRSGKGYKVFLAPYSAAVWTR